VSAKHFEDFELNIDKEYLLSNPVIKKLKENIKKDRILIVDTDTELGMKIAAMLKLELHTEPILSYNFLFHEHGIVGSRELIEDLVNVSMRMEPMELDTYAFILDNNRYNDNIDLSNPMLFNNQYEVTEEELPDIEALNKLGIKTVAYYHTGVIKEDISTYLKFLETNNIYIDMIDLGEQT
jgi:hypothetical protein